jgi:predicted Fe-Mo cluster-binding NifX family protein
VEALVNAQRELAQVVPSQLLVRPGKQRAGARCATLESMRVAIPVTNGRIPNHLGHCASFLVCDVEAGVVVKESELPNPGHGPGGPPPMFLVRLGVDQVIAWGIPPHGHGILREHGVKVQLGATGDPRAAVRAFLAGTLELTTDGLDAGGGCEHSALDDHDHDH